MIFQKKVDRALEKLHEDSDVAKVEREQEAGADYEPEKLELEKNDFLAMVIAALITILPVALIVLIGITLIGYFMLMH